MGYRTFAAGEKTTAAQIQDNLMKQAVIVCTSGTRPSSPPEGMTIYETDTDKLLIYTTATTAWVPPWNLPWGLVAAQAVKGSDQSGIGASYTDVTGLSVTWTAVANRRYRLTSTMFVSQETSLAGISLLIADASNNTRSSAAMQATLGVGYVGVVPVEGIWSPSAGSQTVKVRANTGASTCTAKAGSTLTVEDVGPSAAPA